MRVNGYGPMKFLTKITKGYRSVSDKRFWGWGGARANRAKDRGVALTEWLRVDQTNNKQPQRAAMLGAMVVARQ